MLYYNCSLYINIHIYCSGDVIVKNALFDTARGCVASVLCDNPIYQDRWAK